MNPILEKRWTAFASHFASSDWERRYLPDEQAETAILHLYHQFDEIGGYLDGLAQYIDMAAASNDS